MINNMAGFRGQNLNGQVEKNENPGKHILGESARKRSLVFRLGQRIIDCRTQPICFRQSIRSNAWVTRSCETAIWRASSSFLRIMDPVS